MNSKLFVLFIGFAFALVMLQCKTTQESEIAPVDQSKIRGFTQFMIYKSEQNPILGYVSTSLQENDSLFNAQVWEGRFIKDPTKQDIHIKYNKETSAQFSHAFKNIVNLDFALKDQRDVELVLVNPTEVILKDPSPALNYEKSKEYLSKPFIGSLLYADKIYFNIREKNGKLLSAGVGSKYLQGSASIKVQSDDSQNSTFKAENVYIGYKLSKPPFDAIEKKPFYFDYQFLLNERGKAGWKRVGHKEDVKSGDSIRVMMRASNSCYVYLFNIDATEKVSLVFPHDNVKYGNPIEPNREYQFPESLDEGFTFDSNTGMEEFYFVVLRSESKEMKDLVKLAKEGKLKPSDLKSNPIITSKGLIANPQKVKIDIKQKIPELKTEVKRIMGMPKDFTDTFLLYHK